MARARVRRGAGRGRRRDPYPAPPVRGGPRGEARRPASRRTGRDGRDARPHAASLLRHRVRPARAELRRGPRRRGRQGARHLHARGHVRRRRQRPAHAARGADQRHPHQAAGCLEDPWPEGSGVRRGAAAIAVLTAACAGVPEARAETFRETFERPITRPIGDALADSIGHALPITAASAGVTFSFNKESHAWERETDILGQLYLERPRPLGRGKLNLSVSYQWVRADTVDGQDLDRLSDTHFPILNPKNGGLFTLPRFGLDLETHQVTTSVTYGATDDLDLNLTIPVLYSRFGTNVIFRDVATGQEQRARVRSSKVGPGDLFLRGKYRLLHGAWGDQIGRAHV